MLALSVKSLVTLFWRLSFLYFVVASPIQSRVPAYYDPSAGGGSMLADAGYGSGEPLNVIISGLSSPSILTDSGFLNYARSLEFSTECLGIHMGDPQSANLGDGNGAVNQTTELRTDYGDAYLGTCFESLMGGNHLRVFRQNGPNANSSALFLAVSTEEDVSKHHTISADGYNIGRDKLVSSASEKRTYFDGVAYLTTSEDVIDLLAAGSSGVNHGISQDGTVKLLTVAIV